MISKYGKFESYGLVIVGNIYRKSPQFMGKNTVSGEDFPSKTDPSMKTYDVPGIHGLRYVARSYGRVGRPSLIVAQAGQLLLLLGLRSRRKMGQNGEPRLEKWRSLGRYHLCIHIYIYTYSIYIYLYIYIYMYYM